MWFGVYCWVCVCGCSCLWCFVGWCVVLDVCVFRLCFSLFLVLCGWFGYLFGLLFGCGFLFVVCVLGCVVLFGWLCVGLVCLCGIGVLLCCCVVLVLLWPLCGGFVCIFFFFVCWFVEGVLGGF